MSVTGTRTYLYSILAAPGPTITGTRTLKYQILGAGALAAVTGNRTFKYQTGAALTPTTSRGLHRVVRATVAGETITLRLVP